LSRYSAAFLERLTPALESNRDPRRAAEITAYMRGQFAFIGIGSAARDALMLHAADGLGMPSECDLSDLALACWKRADRDYQHVACRMLRRHTSVLTPSSLAVLERLITTKSWWDTVDELATHVVGSLVKRNPKLAKTMDAWIASENIWLARTAILHQTRYKGDTDEERLFAYCRCRAPDTEFFIRKAIGWALREYGKTNPAAVKQFVADNEAALSGLSKREALKHVG
jgi:3-methyladenine DNA glycosylase AlkD